MDNQTIRPVLRLRRDTWLGRSDDDLVLPMGTECKLADIIINDDRSVLLFVEFLRPDNGEWDIEWLSIDNFEARY